MSTRKIGPASLARLMGGWHRVGGKVPAYRQIQHALRLLILDGRLPIGVRLPGERHLAEVLGVSRTTIGAAYAGLRDLGFVVSRHGSGSLTRLPSEAKRLPDEAHDDSLMEFSIAAPPAPKEIHAAYTSALAELPIYLPALGYEPAGLVGLRQVIADRYVRRGVPTAPDEILVTQGAQHGLVLALSLLSRPGDQVVVDQPTYPKALDAIANASCQAIPVPLPPSGWDIEMLDATLRQTGARISYLIPDFHNPSGRCMNEFSRAALAKIMVDRGCNLIVDETMADLWLDQGPPSPVAHFDRGGKIISLGSMSKSYWGGMRIGWVRADRDIIRAMALHRSSHDMGGPVLEQLAAMSLLRNEESSLPDKRDQIRRQRDHLLALLGRKFPDWNFENPQGGLSVWVELPVPVAIALTAAAREQGLRIAPGSRFGVDGALNRFLRLPYSLPESSIDVAVERLSCAWDNVANGKCRTTKLDPDNLTSAI
ncbi:MocR-like transcription factor YczR [Altererythrobacter sp. Z27]|uniref:MocR-like transcription factor YczR n=1 Tax=Altererythrobacter sp. Z27 TaxID=3461147 RepID=UPI004044AADA